MDDKKLEALAKELAKDIKSEKDLSDLSRRLNISSYALLKFLKLFECGTYCRYIEFSSYLKMVHF